MNRRLVVTKVIAGKAVTLARRYLMNTVLNFLTLYVFFAFIFFGGRLLVPDLLSESVGPVVVGYFLFTMAVTAYADLTHDLTDEAQWGTLEQLSMSPVGFTQVVAIQTLVNLAGTFARGVLLLVLMLLTADVTLYLPPVTLAVLGGLTLAPVVGLGFLFGGAALVYKQLGRLFSLVQLSFVGLLVLPVREFPLLKFLPMALGSHLLQRVMTDEVRLWHLPAADLAVLVVTAVAYVGVGLLTFRFAARKARERGVLGHY